jgi:SAM-dependent methyltransferase
MPVLQISRQPDALAWFDSVRGRPLLVAEQALIGAAMASRPAQQPWLWLAPQAPAAGSVELPRRSLVLYRQQGRFSGSLHCGLPLPLPNESIGNLIVQHALDDGVDGLLDECARVLEPGGRLWLFTLNPWSPYRARWRRSGLMARDAQAWYRVLRGLGLQPRPGGIAYLGPVWRMASDPLANPVNPGSSRLRAVCLLEFEKRSAALIPPAPVSRQWQAGATPA